MGVAWLSPLFLVGAVAAVIPIALHLFLRRRAAIVDFAAMRYLRTAPIEHESTRRLKEWLLLALRVAALVLLAVAFARPYVAQGVAAAESPATVIMIDVSASLTGPGQFERARRLALDALASVPLTQGVGVVPFGGAASVVPVTTDRAEARLALQQTAPGAGATRYADALARGAELLGSGGGRLVVVTDLQSSGWDVMAASEVPASVEVEVRDAGGPATNTAVDSLRREGSEAVAVIHNYGPLPATHQVTFARGDVSLGRVSVTVPALATTEARVPLDAAAGGHISATVDDSVGYAADNTRYAVLDVARPRRVGVVSASGGAAGDVYVLRALEAAEGTSRSDVRPLSASHVSGMTASDFGEMDAVVILGTRGLDQRGREGLAGFVRGGGGVLVAAGPDVDLSFIRDAFGALVKTTVRAPGKGGDLEAPLTFAPEGMRHPVFRPLGDFGTLALVEFRRVVTLDAADPAEVLARFSDGSPALVDERAGEGGHVLIFASDMGNVWNTLPLQPAFAPFLHEAVSYLAARTQDRSEYYAGELAQTGGNVPGVIDLDGRVRRRVAVNVDRRESDPATLSAQAFAAAIVPLKTEAVERQAEEVRGSEQSQRLWQYGLGMMLVLLVAEGALGRKMG